MDGRPVDPNDAFAKEEFTIRHEFTAKEAIRTYPFWVFTLAMCLLAFMGTVLPFLGESIARSVGMPAADYFRLFQYTIVFHVASNFFYGWLSGVTRLCWCLLLQMFGILTSCFGLTLLPTGTGQLLFCLGNGVAWGGFGALSGITYPRFFGRKHLGQISSWNLSALVIASALGPASFAALYNWLGTYSSSFFGVACLAGLLGIASLRAHNPQLRA
jgi:hypothetical protein